MAVPYAQAMLIEKITAANCLRARASSSEEAFWRETVTVVHRNCIFPDQDATVGRRQVGLVAGSVGARMSETELGAALSLHLNAQLDETRLRQLIGQLAKRTDA